MSNPRRTSPTTPPAHPVREKTWAPPIRPVGLVGLTPIIVLATIGLYFLLGGPPSIYLPLTIIAAVFTWLLWLFAPVLRLKRALKKHGRFLCIRCFYPLRGLPDTGLCPECAEPYTRDQLARLWRNWELSHNKAKPVVGEGESAPDRANDPCH